MAPPVKGLWAARNIAVDNATNIWGTGINPVHAIYGEGPPIRVGGREGATSGLAPAVGGDQFAPITPAAEGVEGYVENPPDYGYMPEDIAGLDVFESDHASTHGIEFLQDGWPAWDKTTPDTRAVTDQKAIYPVGAPFSVAEKIRSFRYGPRDTDSKVSNQVPVETVSEGWENKATGQLADSEPSDPIQYERQTSMQQRYATRNNEAAQKRGTDDARTDIKSRVAGQVRKVFSGELPDSERAYDMFPFQQDQINRPFHYRVAGTGPQEWMDPNEMVVLQSVRRTPPADPSTGVPETSSDMNFGYTEEDNFYA